MESVSHVTLMKEGVCVCERERERASASASHACVCAGEEQKEREAELHSPTRIPVDRNISFWARFVELQV